MEENKNNKEFEKIEVPDPKLPEFKKQLKLTLVNTKRAAVLGTLLMILPVYFALSMILKYYLGMGFLAPPMEFLLGFEFFDAVSPLIFLGGLVLAVMINLLAVLHVSFDQTNKEFMLNVSIKKNLPNLVILGISGLFFFVFMLYGFLENWVH